MNELIIRQLCYSVIQVRFETKKITSLCTFIPLAVAWYRLLFLHVALLLLTSCAVDAALSMTKHFSAPS